MTDEDLGAGVAILDASGRPVAFNRALQKLLGLSGDGGSRLGDILSSARGEEQSASGGPRLLVLPGFEDVIATLERLGTVEILVVQRRAALSQGAPAAMLAAARAEALSRLADCVVHDIRNPLNAMAIHLEVLGGKVASEGRLAESAERHLGAMRAQIARVDELLRRFIEFARPGRGDRGGIDLGGLVTDALELCAHCGRKRGVKLEARLEEAVLACDAERATEVVLQAVVQGIDACPPGGALEIVVSSVGGWAVLRTLSRAPAESARAGRPRTGQEIAPAALEEAIRRCGGEFGFVAERGAAGMEVRLPLRVGPRVDRRLEVEEDVRTEPTLPRSGNSAT